MRIVGIDIGTTSVCGIALDVDTGCVIKSRTENSNAFIDNSESWEKIQSVDKIMAVAMDILNDLTDDTTAVVGVTGQMHGIVYTDNDGNAVSPLYTWQDGRGNQEYRGTTYAEFLGSSTGYGVVTDFYNKENGIRPETAVNYCTIHDYLVMKLCGLRTPVIHDTDYASFGKGVRDNNAEVVSGYKIVGEYKGIPVGVAIGDNQASVFSTLANENDILLNVGTGSQISVISDIPVNADNIETRPYFDGKYLVVGAALCGGRAYSILKNFYYQVFGYVTDIKETDVYDIMNKMISDTELSVSVDTRFAGTRSDSSITGSISGITENNFTPGQITLGVLDGIVKELYNMYKIMNIKKSGLVGSGNGIRKNSSLVKCAELIFESKMQIPSHVEEAAFGAALYGGVACGIIRDRQKFIRYEG